MNATIDRKRDVWQDNDLNLDGSRVIDRAIYVDSEIYEAEIDRVFAKTWQWIAHESELLEIGDYVSAVIANKPIVVARGDDGKLNAFFNTCTHRGAALAVKQKGNNGGSFTCMYHAWCFDNAGKLLAAPMDKAYGGNLKKASYDIPQVRLESFAGNLFVSLDPDIRSLESFLGESGPHLARFTGEHEVLGRVRWKLEGNWKLWHENFRDNYHPAFTHLALGASYQGVAVEGVNLDLEDGHGALVFPMQGDPSRIVPLVRRITGSAPMTTALPPRDQRAAEDNKIIIMAVFPNMDFQYSPGGIQHFHLQTVRPLSANEAVIEIIVFAPKGEPADIRQERLATSLDYQAASGKVSGDDNEAARRCATGFGALPYVRWSNMDRGQAPGLVGDKNDEHSLRSFYVAYKAFMGDALEPPHVEAPVSMHEGM